MAVAPVLEHAQFMANVMDGFLRLTRDCGMTLRGAAQQLGHSPSLFSGKDSMLARYVRGGVAALAPKRREGRPSSLTARIEWLGWFLPAARFFYAGTNRTFERGSVPEAVRRTIWLPVLPVGWQMDIRARFLKAIGLAEPPTCPLELREELLARERAGKTLVPDRVARQIALSAALVRQHRNPANAGLDYFSAAGSMFFFVDPFTGERRPPKPGEVIEADDATINFPVCVPWELGGDPCSERYGVKVGRFQWLVAIDAARRYVTAWTYVMRPRSSYRGEDAVALMRVHCLQHGIPLVWRFEQGVWKCNLVRHAVESMGSHLHTIWSPHQKPYIEGLFNVLWTKLSVHFPGADVGRFQGESEQACRLLTACQNGHQDPRQHFPMLKSAVAAFDQVVQEKNNTPVHSDIGRWIPADAWQAHFDGRKVRRPDPETAWIFSPYVREWKVSGSTVGGKIRLFEDLAVPFDFVADWLVHYNGVRVRCHFDPTAPDCVGYIVLLENFNGHKAGEFLGAARQINCIASYARLVLGRADDPRDAGRLARQQAAAALRREVRGVVPSGQGIRASEERDGIGTVTKIEARIPQAWRPTIQVCDPVAPDTRIPSVAETRLLAYRGRGRIARLPEAKREQVNQMLLDGVRYREIIAYLGPGTGITLKNLQKWSKFGHRVWLRLREYRLQRSCPSSDPRPRPVISPAL